MAVVMAVGNSDAGVRPLRDEVAGVIQKIQIID
jgi:hypothetical protein